MVQGRARARATQASQRRVTAKEVVERVAVATGELALSRRGKVALGQEGEKGDVLSTAAIAGMTAMKRTSELIPHCHLVPLTGSRVELEPTARGVRATATAEALWQTGVEMEALVGVNVALLTVWDMLKSLEKAADGGYPQTVLGPVTVVRKVKRQA